MIFEELDPLPFLDLNANVHDRAMSAVEKAKEVARRKNRKFVKDVAVDEVAEEEKENGQSYYSWICRGIFQVFF